MDHIGTLTIVHDMVFILREQGQYGKALEWYGRALAGREKVLGVNHPSTQDTIHSLVNLYRIMGQQEQAQMLRLKLHSPLLRSPISTTTSGTVSGVEMISIEVRNIRIGDKV